MAKTKDRSWRQQFMDAFRVLTRSRRNWEVWSDFVHLTACAISNAVDIAHYDMREELYMHIISRYTKDEAEVFPELLAITVMALEENPRQDFLGDRFQLDLALGNAKSGQFYTPYHIGELMANLQGNNLVSEIEKEGYISVNDCCCGAGCLLLAFANAAKEQGVNYQEKILFIAQDIDTTAAMTCYIQLSLLGCSGYVIVGNSLSNEAPQPENIWYTPMYFHEVWVARREIEQWSDVYKTLFSGQ